MSNEEIALELTKIINENSRIYLSENGITETYKRVLKRIKEEE